MTRGKPERWQAITLALLIAGYAGYYLCRSNLSVTMPLLTADLTKTGMDAAEARIRLGTVASIGVFAYALGKFPSGALADIFGGKANFLIGMAGAIVFTILFALAGGVNALTFAWAGNRLLQSLGWAGAIQIVSRWFSWRRYGTVMAAVSMSYLFGDAIARQFMAVLLGYAFSWRAVFFTCAAVLTCLFAICLIWLHESPSSVGGVEAETVPDSLASGIDESDKRNWWTLARPLFQSQRFLIVCGISLGATLMRETFGLWTPTYFMEAAKLTQGEAAAQSSVFSLLGGVSVLLCGWLSDRLGKSGRAVLICSGLLVAGLLLTGLAAGMGSRSPIIAVAFVAAIGFFTIGPYSFLAGAISLDLGGKRASGTASGIIDGIGYLGGVLAGDSMARVSVSFGWTGAFGMLAAVAFAASIAAFFLTMGERKEVVINVSGH
ncbi:MAG: MFS transporter [Bryobacteraceae bacterium]|nr:MFS transporter [Bryobacteraceae bacterium]